MAANRTIFYPLRLTMSPRPSPRPGDYVQAKPRPTSIVCKGYSRPPRYNGNRLGTIPAGTYLGPIIAVEDSDRFVTVLIDGWWINIWRAKRHRDAGGHTGPTFSSEGVDYAHVITREEARRWEDDGWKFHQRYEPRMYIAAPAI